MCLHQATVMTSKCKNDFEAIHLVGILGGKSAFSEVFCFSLGILNFLREKWRFFTFSKGKCKIPRNFDFSLRFFTFPSVFWLFWGKSGGFLLFPRENAKYPGILTFPSGFSLFPPKYLQFSLQNTEEKVKNQRENSKYRGILHFPLEKVKNLHFSLRKVKILREKWKTGGESQNSGVFCIFPWKN